MSARPFFACGASFLVVAVAAALAVATSACASARADATGGRPAPNPSDVQFMTRMIPHHAQAILIAQWAETHGASQAIRTVSERAIVSQRDEIDFMQRWLRERGLEVPDASPSHAGHDTDHPYGMLSPEQLEQLDAARGAEFDRLLLTFRIQHHQGAITMVDELFSSPGAAQEDAIFQFASDVSADQAAEIDRMNRMLENLLDGGK